MATAEAGISLVIFFVLMLLLAIIIIPAIVIMATAEAGTSLVIFFVLMLLLIPAIVISFIVFWIIMLVDAAQRKFKNDTDKVVWILVVVLADIIGAIIYYFMVKKPDKH